MVPQPMEAVVTAMLYRTPHFRLWMVQWVLAELQLARVLLLPMAMAVYMSTSPRVPLHCTKKELVVQLSSASTWSGRHGADGGRGWLSVNQSINQWAEEGRVPKNFIQLVKTELVFIIFHNKLNLKQSTLYFKIFCIRCVKYKLYKHNCCSQYYTYIFMKCNKTGTY